MEFRFSSSTGDALLTFVDKPLVSGKYFNTPAIKYNNGKDNVTFNGTKNDLLVNKNIKLAYSYSTTSSVKVGKWQLLMLKYLILVWMHLIL